MARNWAERTSSALVVSQGDTVRYSVPPMASSPTSKSDRTGPPSKADDVFYCPRCGQKHRGDLTAAKSGSQVRVRCVGCGTGLAVEWKDGSAAVSVPPGS